MAVTLTPSVYSSQSSVRFNTEHRISAGTRRDHGEQLVIPFDRYTLRAFAAAIDPATNLSVYISRFVIATPLGTFEILSHDMDTSEPTYNPGNASITPYFVLRVLSAEIKRSTISRTFTISLALFNCLLTIGMVYVTVLVVLGEIEANNAVAFMPFSMMLTVPAVRALYAEPPSFAASLGRLRTRRPAPSSSDHICRYCGLLCRTSVHRALRVSLVTKTHLRAICAFPWRPHTCCKWCMDVYQ